VEAKTFCHYMKHNTIPNWNDIQKDLTFKADPDAEEPHDEIQTPMVPTEFILGVADLTGELMRRCINCVGMGQLDTCKEVCSFMRLLYKGFVAVNCPGNREMGRKIYTFRQSLMKTENVCYTIHVRGSEVPKHLLADAVNMPSENMEDDEGFY
jgi:predicted translin family RNA/ssDNA-binding protein